MSPSKLIDTTPEHRLSTLTPVERQLVEKVDALLPQTQCRQCGTDGCLSYACEIVCDGAQHNRCAPGGAKGIERLSALLSRPNLPLDPEYGTEVPFAVAKIKAEACIGCTWCIKACPTDAIVGAPKHLHAVLADRCTGCGLCLPACPMDCIVWEETGESWDDEKAQAARTFFYETRERRHAWEVKENERLNQLRHPTLTKTPTPQTSTSSEASSPTKPSTSGTAPKSALIAAIMKKARQGA